MNDELMKLYFEFTNYNIILVFGIICTMSGVFLIDMSNSTIKLISASIILIGGFVLGVMGLYVSRKTRNKIDSLEE